MPHFYFGPLNKDRQFLLYSYATTEQADTDFYEAYDPWFLTRKAKLLYDMYNKAASLVPTVGNEDTSADTEQQEVRNLLATELHCTAYHQTEALIALLLAEYQNRPDWVYLTSYANADIKEAAKGIAKDVTPIPGTSAESLRKFAMQGVYANWDLSKTEFSASWEASIASIVALLQIVSEQFVEGHEYNSYKHGLRVVVGSAALAMASGESQRDVQTVAVMPHAMTFLQIEKLGEDYGAHMMTKETKPEYSVNVIECMGLLLATIKTFRQARLQGTLPPEFGLPCFDTMLLDRVKPVAKFGFSY